MTIIKVEHIDFELAIECNNLEPVFNKARNRQSEFATATTYSITEGSLSVHCFGQQCLVPLPAGNHHPLVFENKEYFVSITFRHPEVIEAPYIYSRLKQVADRFFYRQELGFLAGNVNFGNDLGQSVLILRYTKGGEPQEFRFHFEVFPTKLNYRSDYKKIVTDIQNEYPYLVLDYLRKTYSSFKTGNIGNTHLIWWQIFGGLYNDFIRASRYILNKPHGRMIETTDHIKAEKIRIWDTAIEEAYAQYKYQPHKNYRSTHKELNTDTVENRFLKFAVFQTCQRYKNVRSFIQTHYAGALTAAFLQEIQNLGQQLEQMVAHPFFKTIGKFKAIKQESLVLQKATGYSAIYKCWIMLNSGLQFLEGIQEIELKNMAELYQLWCFIEIKNVLQKLLGKTSPDDLELSIIQPDDFVFAIARGVRSRVSFRLANGTLIDLYHDLSYDTLPDLPVKSYTIKQRPDIVLNITKNDLKENYVLTYLFDAKYQLSSDDKEGLPDLPTEASINQMHRYRDAIYFVNKDKNKPEKEIIGAYVLFPGAGNIQAIQQSYFYQSISAVNIGALPLRPNDYINRTLLENHLKTIIGLDTDVVLDHVSTQKGSVYEWHNPYVLIGIVPSLRHAHCFQGSDSPFYYSGPSKPSRFGFNQLKYFAPYIQGKGIKEYYEILSYDIIPRNQILNAPEAKPGDHSERLVIWLGQKKVIGEGNYLKINASVRTPYHYTDLKNIRTPQGNIIRVIKEPGTGVK
ncbi:DUF2357 domain-containing protein [Polluticaenibacter yanchengensis]|uniref:DUF2357 domain-containing protein n=1 Tax=Polluticaenibacter yanchengensis TaxID=3014562 RepID=A0ABT4UHP6_9BACT|nr:DUF2357 domain-containing protein [Chitinophagaceae bacterium LY-5]